MEAIKTVGSVISSLHSKGYAHCRSIRKEIGFQNKTVSTALGAGRGLFHSFPFSSCHDRPLLVGKCVRFWAMGLLINYLWFNRSKTSLYAEGAYSVKKEFSIQS